MGKAESGSTDNDFKLLMYKKKKQLVIVHLIV